MMERISDSPVLKCEGLDVGNLAVPQFEVNSGEIVKLVFQTEHASEMHRAAEMIRSGSRLTGPATGVELALGRAWIKELFHRQTAAEWLVTHCRMSKQDAVERLNRVQIDSEAPLCQLAGNPRWLIGFVAAMHQRPAALVFTTTGCDAVGMKKALATVSAQLGDAVGVYLCCFPNLGIEEPVYAATLNVTVRNHAMAE